MNTSASSGESDSRSGESESLVVGNGEILYSSIEKSTIPRTTSATQHSYSGSRSYMSLLILDDDGDLSEGTPMDGDLSIGSDNDCNKLHRHLKLVDLISIGVAATVGSGIFVLNGLIAHDYAGPSTFICWGIAGLSCSVSGLCYAELSGKYATSGSTYSYVKLTMGEIPAIAAGACLTLEYVIASSAVARSWGDKVVSLIVTFYMDDDVDAETNTLLKILEPGYNLNPMAFLISIGAVTLLLRGVKESKRATLFFTALKVTLIAFMCIVSLSLFKKENLVPMLPSQFGVQGILRGSTSSFFGYIGFDEICCMGGEVVNPTKNLPRAVMGTIGLVTIMYVLAAIGLVGMVPYEYISPTSGFPEGFQYRGYDAIAQITALGEIITLPIVVLVTTMAQPRLQYAMAIDGLLPQIFAKVDATGNLWFGTLFAGTIMITVATCVPFTFLNDLISAGVLMAFSMTAASVILLRQQSPKGQPFMLEKLLIKFNILSLSMGLLIHLADFDMTGQLLTFLNFLMLIGLAIKIGTKCPLIASNNGGVVYFQTPLVPYLPLFAQFMNWYLMGQLGPYSVLLLLGYVTMAVVPYLLFGQGKSLSKDQDEQQGELTNSDSDSSSSQISLSPMTEEIIFI